MSERVLSGRTLGEFILREQIGEGGHGVVYRGEQPVLERDVVIKVMRERHCDEVSQRRFLREAKLASLLDHPYAAHVYAFGVEPQDGLLWIAMERVRGVPLDRWLEVHGPMPLDQFVPFFECVAQVVHAAHERRIVHRDLKPSNIMVVEHGGRLFPKLLDFGIAKADLEVTLPVPASWPDGSLTPDREPADAPDPDDVDTVRMLRRPRPAPRARADSEPAGSPASRPGLTPSGACIGSGPYMAPEQWCNAEAVGPAADVYALGIVAYQALSGRLPFTADSTGEYFFQHRHEQVPSLGGSFPSDFDHAIRRALDKYPRSRQRSALELAADLRAALRASKREQLRASAQQWLDQAGAPDLLWGANVLEDAMRSVPREVLSPLECSFVAESQQRIRRTRWVRRSLVALVAAVAIGGFQYRAVMQTRQATLQTQLAQEQTRLARAVAEATVTQSELEQGRSALLVDSGAEAQLHLREAYRRDRSAPTAFMLARALQPRLAERAHLTSSFGRMWSAAFSPDGKQIVTTDDRNAQVWSAQTYRLRFMLSHGSRVYHAMYSADGTRLVTVAEDAVRIWDASSGVLMRKLTRKRSDGRPSDYFIAAISLDGKLVAAIDAAGSLVHVWDPITGTPLVELHGDGLEFPGLAFSADSHWLAMTAGNDVHVFNTQTWTQSLTIRGPGIHRLAFDPTGTRLLTGAATGDVTIWAIPSGARIQHLREIGDPVDAVAFSPDGQLVIAGGRDGVELVWHARSGELQSQLNPRHSKIFAVEFDRTSKLALAACADGTVVVSDAAQGIPVTVLEGPQNVKVVAQFDPSSRYIVGAARDGTARVWDATTPYRRWSSPRMSDDCGLGTSSEPDRRFIAVGCRDRATRVWDTARGQLLAELPPVAHVPGDFLSAFPAVSAEGGRAAIARGNTVEVYELPGGRRLRTIAHGAAVNAVAFADAGRDLVSGAIDGSLRVTRDGGTQLTLPTSPGGIDAVEFLPDGRLVSADAHRRLRVYDPGGAVLADFEIPARVMSLRVDGARLVAIPIIPINTGDTPPPLLVDLERYRVIAQLEGHLGRVYSARWVAGNQILTAGSDGTARLWDGPTGQLRQIYRGSSRALLDATLASDGLVMAGGADGLLRFWDRDSGRLLWALHAQASQIIGVHVEGGDIVTRGFAGELSRWALPSSEQVIRACNDQEFCGMMWQ
ncbi:MAG TPA: WD40 repeat domain-containing serine/threonine-protein kinase [Kofleriaceae bacterium]